MGIHLVIVAAFHVARVGGGASASMSLSSTPRIAANLIWPFLIKLILSLKVSPNDLVSSSRFFVFQIAQIFARNNNAAVNNNNNNNSNNNDSNSNNSNNVDNNSRWNRAVRLVRQRIALATDSSVSLPHADEQSLQIFSMLAL